MATVSELLSTPGCRRRRLLAFFGEARGACDAAVELPCDFCTDPTGMRRRLAERDARAHAHAARERARELAAGRGDGSGSEDGGSTSGGEGEDDGQVVRTGGGGGWGSAAWLEAGDQDAGGGGPDAGASRLGCEDALLPVVQQQAALPPLLGPQEQQQQQEQQQPSRPVLASLSWGRYGNGAARPVNAGFKAPRMVKQLQPPPHAQQQVGVAAAVAVSGPAAAQLTVEEHRDESADAATVDDGVTGHAGGGDGPGVALLPMTRPASVRVPSMVPRLQKRLRSSGIGSGPGAAAAGAWAEPCHAAADALGALGAAAGAGASAAAEPEAGAGRSAPSSMPLTVHAAARRAFKPPLRR